MTPPDDGPASTPPAAVGPPPGGGQPGIPHGYAPAYAPGAAPGTPPPGYHHAPAPGHAQQGYTQSGYAQPGYPQPGYAQPGYPQPGYPQPGYRPMPPPAVGPGGQPLAQFGDRLLAYIIDVALLSVVSMVLALPVFFFVLVNLSSRIETADPYAESDPAGVMTGFLLPLLLVEAGFFLLVLVLYYIYDVEMMHRSGQTLGKKIMKLRIVPLDPAATLTRGAATKRYGVQFVAGALLPFFSYVDGLWQLWDKPYQQALHDKAAGTIVIKVTA